MTFIESILGQEAARALGWALVHSVWQGALVAALYGCACALVGRRRANVRYVCALVALLLMLVLPVVTVCLASSSTPGLFAREEVSEGAQPDSARERVRASRGGDESVMAAARDERGEATASTSTLLARAEERLASLVPLFTFVWLAGVCVLGSRFAAGWMIVRRLRRSAEPVAEEFERLLARVAERVRVSRAVRLCRSALVEVPTVVGHLRPIILVPASTLVGLTPGQLEAVLAHELAHVRRYDYLANLLQTAAETLLFYHPATWWLSRRARAEREHACDDAAIECVGDVLLYARSLAALETLRAPAPALALAANGGSLVRRIQRLVDANSCGRDRRPYLAAALLASLALGALALALTPAHAGAGRAGTADHAANPQRKVAVTFVAFPGNNIYDDVRLAAKTHKLMRSLAAEKISAVAFVNEARLYKEDGSINEARVALLREWLDAGHELGNETYSHKSLYDTPVAEFESEVERGEQIMSKLLAERGRRLRYFSYPYLNTGATLADKTEVEKYLASRGYRIHPVTIDNMDWLFNRAYSEAIRREDEQTAARIRTEYVAYMEHMFGFFEGYSREVVGREIPQVLMLTAGPLNADTFDELASMLRRRGYSFVTMDEATRDEAYSLPDTYTGRHGDSWIARWAATKGMEYKDTEEEQLGAYMQSYFDDFVKKQQAEKSKSGGRK